MNYADMLIDKIIYKKFSNSTDSEHYFSVLLNSSEEMGQKEKEVSSFIPKLSGKLRITMTCKHFYTSDTQASILVYKGNELILEEEFTVDRVASSSGERNSFHTVSIDVEALKEYRIVARVSVVDIKVSTQVEGSIIDNAEEYILIT